MAYNYETRHQLKEHDFGALDVFDFEYAPVGMKFFNAKPTDDLKLARLEEKLPWCVMLKRAQEGASFYATEEEQYCEPGIFLPGHGPADPIAGGGMIGPAFDLYPDERANRRVYDNMTYLRVGSVHSTAFAPLAKLTFEPDLLIITCDNMDQTSRLLRAIQHDTGDTIESKMGYVMSCNWMFTYPYVSGKVNYITTGIGYGMKMYKLYPAGIQIVSIPWMHIDRVLKNLREMPYPVPGHTDQKEDFYKVAHARLGVDQII